MTMNSNRDDLAFVLIFIYLKQNKPKNLTVLRAEIFVIKQGVQFQVLLRKCVYCLKKPFKQMV